MCVRWLSCSLNITTNPPRFVYRGVEWVLNEDSELLTWSADGND